MNMHTTRSINARSLRRIAAGLAGSAVLAAIPPDAQAQGWSFEPVVRVGLETDDNAQLDFRTDEEISLEGFLADLVATMRYESTRSDFEFAPRLLVRNYSDEPEFDSDDVFLSSLYRHRWQNSSFDISAFYDSQQVRNAERADVDLDTDDPDTDITDDETGRVGLIGDRERWRLLSSWSQQLSESSSIDAAIKYTNVRYDDIFSGLLTDYDDIRLNLGYRYAFSVRTSGIILATGRDYQSKNADPESELNGYGAMAGFEHDLSNTSRVRVLLGAESTDATNGGSTTEPIGEVMFRRKLETMRLLARYERLVNSSGAGRLTVRDSVSLNATRELNLRMSAGLGIRAYQDEPLGESDAVEDRQFVQIRARFTWHFSPSMSAEFDYRYTLLDRGSLVGEGANSNQINLWFSYHPNSNRSE